MGTNFRLAYNRKSQLLWVPDMMQSGRDFRLDFIRGLAMFFVIINHLPIPSLLYLVTVERIGVVSGAELFVVLSGMVLGLVHQRRIAKDGWKSSAKALVGRASQLYLVIVVVALVVWSLELLPGMQNHALTTWTDISSGVQYRLFPDDPFANPFHNLTNLLLLRLTPWQFNIMGLYVFLVALAPLALWALKRRWTFWLLLISWGLYLLNSWLKIRVTPSIFEGSFPLLTWQILFFHALAAGYHYHKLMVFFGTRLGRFTVGLAVLGTLCFMFYALNNPWDAYPYGQIPQWARLQVIPEGIFNRLYALLFFERTWLGIGRLVNIAVLVVALYALLSRWWRFTYQALGWLLIPLGQASLYVFIMHLPVVLLIDLAVGAGIDQILPNTILHLMAVVLLWLAVQKRFLFRYIPR